MSNQKIIDFENCVSSTLFMSQTPRRKYNYANSNIHNGPSIDNSFWNSIQLAMKLYTDLILTSDLNSDRVSKLVHLLHNGLRTNRNQLTKMNKKPDYDSKSFHKEITNYLCKSLRVIANDVLLDKINLNEYGAMHLITAFKELLLFDECISIWQNSINSKNNYTSNIFLNPRVVGVILPILYDHGIPYDQIQLLYEKSSSMINYFHPNLSVGMIRASLSSGNIPMALSLFEKLSQESTEMKFGYLIETHLSFIGECKDLEVAQLFFDKALNNEMPYKIDLQVSYVKSFLNNIWSQKKDFNHVYQIWYISSLHYGKNVNHGISSSLNDTFFNIFFEHFKSNKLDGFNHLKSIIITYNNIKPIDEPFFNIILTKCSIWHDSNIIEFIDNSYDYYKIEKTIVSYRILLKSMGSIDNVENNIILSRWLDLVIKSDHIGQRFIANADWAALRDATITWAQDLSNKSNLTVPSSDQSLLVSVSSNDTAVPTPIGSPISKTNSNNEIFTRVPSTENIDFNHPAFAAANASGAFDDVRMKNKPMTLYGTTNTMYQRIILYLKIVKKYSKFCRDTRQLTRLTSGTALKYSCLQSVLNEFPSLDTSDIPIPQLHSLKQSF
ncbi:hypothetical protein Kpol_1002p91 [Vanderwaltozyma polyspora DSM 70294]|uniref:Protein RMD9-like, mitochondrial n=1 Tax=Vanderwaltozyma polyspora (strain ATCC 22028 / DSM 70294 / BCRC 21397 / CBS 2163 / NBRC 10782 / NRRL Y-8283 / UCD 57-17) TaxID=436907 RepID=A7TEC1_VANPO|nr:uncharacterized protein Kpol_1002p91 [Vanderwaltozyma polyspora DSM 70294]EDO19443.1 hypothetical protein Kpol_1002p91 [Vanderwaltozyma polyspora DSM 70294]